MLGGVISILLLLLQQGLLAPTPDCSHIKALLGNGTSNIFVTMKDSPSEAVKSLGNPSFLNRKDRGERGARAKAVRDKLQQLSEESQADAVQLLEKERKEKKFTYKSFWITNQIYIRDADLETCNKLAKHPKVGDISEEAVIPLEPALDLTVFDNDTSIDTVEWGISKINADQVWANGNTGWGTLIGQIDTGVRGSHVALVNNYWGTYGWFDPISGTSTPNDVNGHGTHTMGTIAGKNGYGVAPGCSWMACKGCGVSSCAQSDLTDCGQFMLCPTLPDGSNPDCSNAPHIVSNSWGGGQGQTWYNSVITSWRAADIIPVFSIGNSGPSCATANSPGDNTNVIGVGSTTSTDAISSFSSRGPTVGAAMKPDVCAPGSSVTSAYFTSDTASASLSGTSMACPHVAGTIALMIASDWSTYYSYSALKTALQSGCVQNAAAGASCLSVSDTTVPNHIDGYGRIDALNAINNL